MSLPELAPEPEPTPEHPDAPFYAGLVVMRSTPLDRAEYVALTRSMLNHIRIAMGGDMKKVERFDVWKDWLAVLDASDAEPDYRYTALPSTDPVFRWWVAGGTALTKRHGESIGATQSLLVQQASYSVYCWLAAAAKAIRAPWITYVAPSPWAVDQSSRYPVPCVLTATRKLIMDAEAQVRAKPLADMLAPEVYQLHLAAGMDAAAIARRIKKPPADVALTLWLERRKHERTEGDTTCP